MVEEEEAELLEPESVTEEDPGPDLKVLESPCIRFWLKTYENTSMPWILLDNKLNLLWRNKRHGELFPDFQIHRNLVARYYQTFSGDAAGLLYRSLRNPDIGYSWSGRITHRSQENPTVIANLSISPIFDSDIAIKGGSPSGYVCHFNDVTRETREMLRNTFLSLLEASKLKDNDTGNHIERVNAYSRLLAENLYRNPQYGEIDPDFIEDIGFLAAMHDVGKIGTPDDVLNKKGPLEKWEWDIMKEHTKNGAYLLGTYPNKMAREIALSHHERWDGKGYPFGLAENMPPASARIVAVADVYDALRSKRSYKGPMSHGEACGIMEKDSASHFDPNLIEVFIRIKSEFDRIFTTRSDS
jgi:putative two-component system response regulator